MTPTKEHGAFEILRLPLPLPDVPRRLNDISAVRCHLTSTDEAIRGSSTESPYSEQHQIEALTRIDTCNGTDAEQYRVGVAHVRLGNDSLAAEWLGRSARQGNAEAQFLLGIDAMCGGCRSDAALWFRHAAEQGHEESLARLQNSAELGNPHSQWHLGEMCLVGLGVDPSVADGLLWVLCAADQGHAVAVSLLGAAVKQGFDWAPQLGQLVRLIEDRVDAEADWRRCSQRHAREYRASLANGFDPATSSGEQSDLASLRTADRVDAESQYRLGVRCFQLGDSSFAFACMRQAARQGHAWAQFAFGCDHMSRGSWSDAVAWLRDVAAGGHKKALNLLKDCAEAGNPHTQWTLGEMYSLGLGVDVVREEGVLWALCAAKHGHVRAWNLLSSTVKAESEWAPQLRQLLRQVANRGAPEAQCRLGRLHLDSALAEGGTRKAANWSDLAEGNGHGFTLEELHAVAENGEREAQWRLGRLHLDGVVVERDAKEAARWLDLAAGGGHGTALGGRGVAKSGEREAQWRLGRLYLDGVVVERDSREAAKWLGLAAGSGHGAALERLREIAERGDGEAQRQLGRVYLDGTAAERNPREAAMWLDMAVGSGHGAALGELRGVAESGEREAQWRLGRLHLDGVVVERDAKEAARWLDLAAGGGHGTALGGRGVAKSGEREAQWRLGRLYLDGVVVERDSREAAKWLGLAAGSGHGAALERLREIAEGGDGEAQWLLGQLYLNGVVVERDSREAAKWLGLAAGSGHAGALEELRRIAEDGDDASKDVLLVAMPWIQRSADKGCDKAWILVFRACETGNSEAVSFLFQRLEYREQPAVRLLYQEADGGNAWAKSILADFGFPP